VLILKEIVTDKYLNIHTGPKWHLKWNMVRVTVTNFIRKTISRSWFYKNSLEVDKIC